MKEQAAPMGTFRWHNATSFTSALNDNLFKLMCIYVLVDTGRYGGVTDVTFAVSAAFVIPFLLFAALGGVLADRFPKSRVIRTIKVAEIGIMILGVVGAFLGQWWFLLGVMFLMSTQSALFGPSKMGIIPELVGKQNLSRANSFLSAATYIAIILGTAGAPFMYQLFGSNLAIGVACIAVSISGVIFSRKIQDTPQAYETRSASVFFLADIWRSLKLIHKDAFLTLAVWGNMFFMIVAAYVQLNLLPYGEEHVGLPDEKTSTYLFLLTALGIGVGSILAGKVSKRNIEFGIVPIALFLMMISAASLAWFPPNALVPVAIVCFVMGVGAGMFIVPIQAFIQYRAPHEKLGEVVAAANWLNWIGVALATALLKFNSTVLGLSAAQGMLELAAILLAMMVVAFVAVPDFFVRFVLMLMTRCFFRLRGVGLKNIPSEGPALLVSNHVTLMDAVWLLSIQQRRIRFLMSRDYIAKCPGWMRPLLKLGGVIAIQSDDSPKQLIKALKQARKCLDEGYLVGIFAEGALTRTGHMLPIKPGFERVVKGTNYPIIPICIEGAYGTYASHAHGEPKLLHRRDYGKEITVLAGEAMDNTASADEIARRLEELYMQATVERKEWRVSAGRELIRRARLHPKQFLYADSTGKEVTCGTAMVGAYLMRKRLRKVLHGDPEEVGMLLPPSVAGALANIALAMDFRVSVNLNYTASRSAIAHAVESTGMKTLITSRKVLEKFEDFPTPDRVVFLEDVMEGVSVSEKLIALLATRLLPDFLLVNEKYWRPDDALTILFSSGSTAEPKGIVLSHHNIMSDIDSFACIARANPNDVILGVLPFFHSFGYTTTLWFPALCSLGAAFHHHPLETDAINELSHKVKPTVLVGTPTFLMAWVRKLDKDAMSRLRWVVAGAEKMRPKLADMFERRFGVRPLEGYGTTECSPVVAVNIPDLTFDEISQKGNKEGTIGRPLPGVLVRVTYPESGEEVAQGEEGLMWVKGSNVMTGYLNAPEKTAEVLIDGWYNTGDVVKIDDEGFITITDRLSRFSKLGGEMVSHSAVETQIQDLLGVGPDALAVTGVPDERKGERLVVIATLAVGDVGEAARTVLQSGMANLMKPDARSWYSLDALPVLGTGKVDLKALNVSARTLANVES